MGKQRDPRRDEAKEIYLSANGEINLTDIASQLGVGDGTLRGWKAKDKWENLLTGETIHLDKDGFVKGRSIIAEDQEERDELFFDAVQIVVEAQQASTSLLQRRLRIGHSRATRLIDKMEESKYIGPYEGSKPRVVLIKELSPVLLMLLDEKSKPESAERNERNAPKKGMERSINAERSQNIKNVTLKEIDEPAKEEVDDGSPDEEGLTPKQKIFVIEYLRDFNATRAAIAAGYSKKTAHSIGWENLRKPEIQNAIRKRNESNMEEISVSAQRVIMEYMKIAFADISDYVDFGQEELIIQNKKGEIQRDEFGSPLTVKINRLAFRESSEVDGTLISEVKEGKDGVSLKLHDKMKALNVLTKYIDLLPDQHRRMIENERLKIEQERLAMDKVKALGEGDADDDLISDWVEAVMDDDDPDGEHYQEDEGIQETDTHISEES